MPSDFVWFRQEFPWLRSGFMHAVASEYIETFVRQVEALQFEVRRMRPSDEQAMFHHLGDLFMFPEYFGGSGWDAVWDCLTDVDVPDRLVIVWEGAATFAQQNPKAFGEACSLLQEFFRSVEGDGKQLLLVLVDEGPTFDRP